MSNDWMSALAAHYEKIKQTYPQDKLLILFDIDGTILDMRYMVHHLLKSYDQTFGTNYFEQLQVADITVHENHIRTMLVDMGIPQEQADKIATWFDREVWATAAILEAHRPFAGVLEVIRWFQMQPNTFIGVNTGRLEKIRFDTLHSLNKLGQEYKVNFTNKLLFMNPHAWEVPVTEAKIAGVKYFQKLGYRVVAFIDNEPKNLQAIADADPDNEILLLHADTIFQSKRADLPSRAVGGNVYTLAGLISHQPLPRHIQFVWHSISTPKGLEHFLNSEIYWGEFDVRIDPVSDELILRKNSFYEDPLQPDEPVLTLNHALDQVRYRKKGIKLNLTAGGQIVDEVLRQVITYGFSGLNLWFNGKIEHVQRRGVDKLVSARPGAVVQCPVDFLAPMICSGSTQARKILTRYSNWGVNRFSISWHTPNLRRLFDQMARWGFEVDIYDVPDLESFLQAVLLMPCSITSNFDVSQHSGYQKHVKQHYYNLIDQDLIVASENV